MLRLLPTLMLKHHFILRLGAAERSYKPLPDIVHRHAGRMHKIIGIETIVAQFVQKNFVRGEITDG